MAVAKKAKKTIKTESVKSNITTNKTLKTEVAKKTTKKKPLRDTKGRFVKKETQVYGYVPYAKKGKKFVPKIGLQPGGEKVKSTKTQIVGRLKGKAISLDQVDPGAVISFKYRGPMAHDPEPFIILLSDGFYKNKIHGLNLRYIPKRLIEVLQNYVIKERIEDEHPKTFYDSKMKPWLKQVLENQGIGSYRVYDRKFISNPKIYAVNIIGI